MCIWQWLKSQSLRTMWVPAFRRHFCDSFWGICQKCRPRASCHSCWNPVCFSNWFSMLRLTSFCPWNRITLRWEENMYFLFRFPKHLPDDFSAFLKWSASGPAWVRFSKRHKSRHMSSLQKVSRETKCEGWKLVGVHRWWWQFVRALRFVWKDLTVWLDISMTYHLTKDQGSNDNDQKSHSFFGWEEMDRRFKGLSFCSDPIRKKWYPLPVVSVNAQSIRDPQWDKPGDHSRKERYGLHNNKFPTLKLR